METQERLSKLDTRLRQLEADGKYYRLSIVSNGKPAVAQVLLNNLIQETYKLMAETKIQRADLAVSGTSASGDSRVWLFAPDGSVRYSYLLKRKQTASSYRPGYYEVETSREYAAD